MRKRRELPPHTEPITTAKLVVAANVEAEARSLGARNLAPPDQAEPTKSEAAVLEIITGRIARRHGELEADGHRIRADLAALPDIRTDDTASSLSANVAQGVGNVMRTFHDQIVKVLDDERGSRAKYNAYRERHSLHESDPQYPVSRIRHMAVVLLLLILEASLNTVMYLPAVSGGVFAAFLTALIVAVIVVGVSVAAAYFPARYLNYHDLPPEDPNRRLKTRAWAIPALLLAVLVIVGVGLFSAHFREVAIRSEGDFDERQVLQHLISNPVELGLASWGLFALTMLCAIVSGYTAYFASTPYPGYEAQDRQYLAKLDDRNDLHVSLHGHIDAVKQTVVEGVANRSVSTRAAIENCRRQHTALVIKAGRTAKLDAADITAAKDATTRFRVINREVRTDKNELRDLATIVNFEALVPTAKDTDLAGLIEAADHEQIAHAETLLALVQAERQRIEAVKDEIDRLFPPIEQGSGERVGQLVGKPQSQPAGTPALISQAA